MSEAICCIPMVVFSGILKVFSISTNLKLHISNCALNISLNLRKKYFLIQSIVIRGLFTLLLILILFKERFTNMQIHCILWYAHNQWVVLLVVIIRLQQQILSMLDGDAVASSIMQCNLICMSLARKCALKYRAAFNGICCKYATVLFLLALIFLTVYLGNLSFCINSILIGF